MLTNFNKPIISYYSPISAKGGRSRRRKTNKKNKKTRNKKTRNIKTRNIKTRNIKTRNKKSGKYSRTKRNYH